MYFLIAIGVLAIIGLGYMFWYFSETNQKRLNEEEDRKIEHAKRYAEPYVIYMPYKKVKHCLSCDAYDMNVNDGVCSNCGAEEINEVIGRWERTYVYVNPGYWGECNIEKQRKFMPKEK